VKAPGVNKHPQSTGTCPDPPTSKQKIQRYLSEIASQLNLDPTRKQDIVEELRSHLEEATAELRAGGLGEEESLAAAIRKFGSSREVGRMLNRLHGEPLWMKVGLAILPGLFALLGSYGLFSALPGGKMGEAVQHVGLIFICVLVIAAGLASERRLPVWSYPAWGLLLLRMWLGFPWPSVDQPGSFWTVAPPLLMLGGLATIAGISGYQAWRSPGLRSCRPALPLLSLIILIAGAFPAASIVAYRDADWGSIFLAMLPLFLWWMGLLVLPVVIGLPLALRSGVVAGLTVVAAQYVVVEELFDPAYGILIWTSNYGAVRLLSALPALAFLIAPPVSVLLSRQTKARFWGLVLPPLLGLLSLWLIRTTALQSTGIEGVAQSSLTHGVGGAQLVALLAVAGLVDHRVGPRRGARAGSINNAASGSISSSWAVDERRA